MSNENRGAINQQNMLLHTRIRVFEHTVKPGKLLTSEDHSSVLITRVFYGTENRNINLLKLL